MNNIKVKTLGAVLAAFATLNTHAAESPEVGEGTLFRSLFGNTLEKDYGIHVSNLLDVAYSRNNRSTHGEQKNGLGNLPLIGFADEGLELGSLHLFVDKAVKGNMVPRVTPLPGPAPSEASFGFTFEMLYGRNAQFARTQGWDMHWDVNSPGDDDLAKAQRGKQKFLALPNLAATAYLPYGTGVTAMAGIFGPAMGYEIPPNLRAARNQFASKTYAFLSEPGTVAGLMLGTRLYNGKSAILGAELGVVQGWNNLRDNNDKKSLMGAVRWPTADMQTWIDYEFILGDEQNDSFSDVQAPTSRLVSPDGQFKQQHSLNGWHRFDSHWSIGADVVYGRQDGDGKTSTVDIINGPGFDGAHWWGANATLTYQQRPDLSYSVRAEHFADPDGFILFPATTARGNFNALTAGLRYDLNKYISLRPEVRYDVFDGNADDHPFGAGRDRSQLTGLVEALFYF
ncbi:MAG TPA: hypothetical protein DIW52_08095 [Pseudomonas sp.]|nr:hypothetical protein [Pseudomonas sp.]